MLSKSRFTFRTLNRHPRGLHSVADRPNDVLILRRLEDVIILNCVGVRSQVGVALGRCLLKAFLEEEELEFGAHLHGVSKLGGAFELALQYLAGRHLDGTVVILKITNHQRRLLQPRNEAHGVKIGNAAHVAVARLPIGETVIRQDVHLDVGGDQVVACLNAMAEGVVDKELAAHALALP